MSALGWMFALVLAAVVGYIVLRPVLAPPRAGEEVAAPTPLDDLQAQRASVLAAIRELDFDYQTGKLTEADYAERREALIQQGVALLKAIDQLTGEASPEAAPAPPDAVRVKESA